MTPLTILMLIYLIIDCLDLIDLIRQLAHVTAEPYPCQDDIHIVGPCIQDMA